MACPIGDDLRAWLQFVVFSALLLRLQPVSLGQCKRVFPPSYLPLLVAIRFARLRASGLGCWLLVGATPGIEVLLDFSVCNKFALADFLLRLV